MIKNYCVTLPPVTLLSLAKINPNPKETAAKAASIWSGWFTNKATPPIIDAIPDSVVFQFFIFNLFKVIFLINGKL